MYLIGFRMINHLIYCVAKVVIRFKAVRLVFGGFSGKAKVSELATVHCCSEVG